MHCKLTAQDYWSKNNAYSHFHLISSKYYVLNVVVGVVNGPLKTMGLAKCSLNFMCLVFSRFLAHKAKC